MSLRHGNSHVFLPCRRHSLPAPTLTDGFGHASTVLAYWHLCSLDAPTVAVVWFAFTSACMGQNVRATTACSLFLAVWIIYASDRLLDAGAPARWRAFSLTTLERADPETPAARSPAPANELEHRHTFHNQHSRTFKLALSVASLGLALLLTQLPARVLVAESVLAALLGAWLLKVHGRSSNQPQRPLPKEFVVGPFFAAAIYLATAARLPWRLAGASPLPGDLLLFATLCSLNCLFVYQWEHPDGTGKPHRWTRWAIRWLQPFAAVFVVSCAWIWLNDPAAPLARLPLACAGSALLLLLLHRRRHRLGDLQRRALADLVLLTPVPLFLLHCAGKLRLHGLQHLAGAFVRR